MSLRIMHHGVLEAVLMWLTERFVLGATGDMAKRGASAEKSVRTDGLHRVFELVTSQGNMLEVVSSAIVSPQDLLGMLREDPADQGIIAVEEKVWCRYESRKKKGEFVLVVGRKMPKMSSAIVKCAREDVTETILRRLFEDFASRLKKVTEGEEQEISVSGLHGLLNFDLLPQAEFHVFSSAHVVRSDELLAALRGKPLSFGGFFGETMREKVWEKRIRPGLLLIVTARMMMSSRTFSSENTPTSSWGPPRR